MNLRDKNLNVLFMISLLLTVTIPSLYPQFRILFFAPFLVTAFYQKPLIRCLWIAIVCGVILDLFSSNTHFGIHPFAYCLAVFILYPLKKAFFADSLSTLPLMTFFFSITVTIPTAILLYTIEMKSVLSLHWIWTDLLLMPMLDAVYAFSLFVLPSLLFGKPQRRGKDYFLTRN